MCITPSRLDDGTEVACRNCKLCRQNRINDLIGRCIAEAKFSTKTYAVTLTYAKRAGVSSVTLVYKDVQDFLKRLRKRYNVRYIVAGEYGTKKGRAHWHIILFFKGEEPDVKENVRVDWKYWPHGFSYFQQPTWKGFRYILKYVLKDQDADSADTHLAMSKKPPLGHEFFMDLAQQHVEQAIAPRSFKYKVGGVRKDNGQEIVFMMQGKTRDNFMTAFKEGWKEKYGKEPTSEFFEEWDEKNYQLEYTDEELVQRLHHKDVIYYQPWETFVEEKDSGTWYELEYQGMPLVMHETNGTAWLYQEDGQQWHEERQDVIESLKTRSITISKRKYYDARREEAELQYLQRQYKQREQRYLVLNSQRP